MKRHTHVKTSLAVFKPEGRTTSTYLAVCWCGATREVRNDVALTPLTPWHTCAACTIPSCIDAPDGADEVPDATR